MQRIGDESPSQGAGAVTSKDDTMAPQADTVTWARMLAVARSADSWDTTRKRNFIPNRPTLARVQLLIPIARVLYNEEVLPTAKAESDRINSVIAHCHVFLMTEESKRQALEQKAPEQWGKQTCLGEMKQMLVPGSFRSLRPISPEVIGVQLTPRSPAWYPVRQAILDGFMDPENRQDRDYRNRRFETRGKHPLFESAVQRVRSVRFVDAVFARAPPLVRALPLQWTAVDMTDARLEALLALLNVAGTRPLVELIERLSEREYSELVEERDCLSQLLVRGAWAAICDNERSFDAYMAFVRFLQTEAAVAGLQSVPKRLGQPKLSAEALYSPKLELVGSAAMIKAPPQMDTAAWACMLAAARGADEIDGDVDPRDLGAYHPTVARLQSLIPIARALYEKAVLPTAIAESERIDVIIAHCRELLKTRESKRQASKTSKVEQWNKQTCMRAMEQMFVPGCFKSLRPATPEVIGVHLIPQSSVWQLLGNAMKQRGSAYTSSSAVFAKRKRYAIKLGELEQDAFRLGNVRFVDSVLDCAPPLVRALPSRWAAAERTSEFIEALLALLKVAYTRPLVELVDTLSEDEYALLVEEHSCLSQLLVRDAWATNCYNGRSVDEYATFVSYLGNHAPLEPVPKRLLGQPKVPMQDVKISAIVRQALPEMDTMAWACMITAARVADEMEPISMRVLGADRPTMARLKLLLPIVRAIYDKVVVPIAAAESRQIEAIITHCQGFLEASESKRDTDAEDASTQSVGLWSEEQCLRAMDRLLVPATFKTLRPAPSEVIGAQLTPLSSAWLLIRMATLRRLSEEERALYAAFGMQLTRPLCKTRLEKSAIHQLRGIRFVDSILGYAPPLVRALPSRWTAADMGNVLLEALLALLKVAGTRPLAELVEKLSASEYAMLVEERACLSRVLENIEWAPSCANERNLQEYVECVRYLGKGAPFEPVPTRLGRPKLSPEVLYSPPKLVLASWTAMTQAPPQMNAVAWACMLAAARGADEMGETAGRHAARANPVTMARLETLLPIARALYDKTVFETAKAESERIGAIIKHCSQFLEAKEYRSNASEPSSVDRWDKETCLDEMDQMLVPLTFKTLRPTKAEVIGVPLIPHSSVWDLLRNAIKEEFSETDKCTSTAFDTLLYATVWRHQVEKGAVQPLGGVPFVDSVLDCAPAVVRALPQGWTNAALNDELIEAFLALVKAAGTRSLVELVEVLSEDEYALLVKERDCLSQLIYGGTWAPSCANGRNVEEYAEFVRYLRQEATFKGALVAVPRKPNKASAKRPWPRQESYVAEASSGGTFTGSTRKRQQLNEGVWKASSLQGELYVPEDWRCDLGELLDQGDPLELDWNADAHGNLVEEYLRDPEVAAMINPTDWMPSDLWGNIAPLPPNIAWEPFGKADAAAGASPKLERPASRAGEPLTRSDSGTVISHVSAIPLVAVVFLGLVVLAAAFRLRARRGFGRQH